MSYNILKPLYPPRAMTNAGGTSAPVASQSLTVGAAASGFATAFNSVSNIVTFDVQTNDVRVRWDGTDPTGAVGHILPTGTSYSFDKGTAAAARFIRISTATADAVIFLSEMSV